MNFYILTLFPDMVMQGLGSSILGRAAQKGYIAAEAVDIRDFTRDKHRKVDDYPYGGGAGMLMQAQPVYDAFLHVKEKIGRENKKTRVIYLTPQGRRFSQEVAQELSGEENLIFLCGHYEGVDERVLEEIVTDHLSIGDYVLTGGELAAMVVIDAVSRLVPGVLNNEASAEGESFHRHLLEYPQYSRPEEWRGRKVPDILLSGDHRRIADWRVERSVERTKERRPDLYGLYERELAAAQGMRKAGKLLHMDMIQLLERGKGEIAAQSEGGLLLRRINSGLFFLTAASREEGCRLLEQLPPGVRVEQLVTHQEFMNREAERRLGLPLFHECRQAVYTGRSEVSVSARPQIRKLAPADAGIVMEHYTLIDGEYMKERLAAGEMFGAFEGDELCGFIGVHDEGSMGMLEVFEPFRRRGIAMALEAFLINRQLRSGFVPFAQIFAENEPSLELQRRLGLHLAKTSLYWLG